MATYEIYYDYCHTEEYDGEWYTSEERNCVETFYGDWSQLQDHLKIMREHGDYSNIYATCVSEDDDEYDYDED